MRVLSGIQPTGRFHWGNYFGMIRQCIELQANNEAYYFIANLHALTTVRNAETLRRNTLDAALDLLALGLDPQRAVLFVQSDVPEVTKLTWLLMAITPMGLLERCVSYKDKVAKGIAADAGLFTYPVLMAADILLHDTDEVPVGDDQTQHLELARDVANRFNTRYGRTFTVPRAVNPPIAARVMDLANPAGKMGKSSTVDSGTIYLLDPPDVVRRKVSRAVTDADARLAYDPVRKPALSNLLEILAACERADPAAVAMRYSSYAQLKEALTDAVVQTLAPIQRSYAQVVADPSTLRDIRRHGAQIASERASHTVARAKAAIGLIEAPTMD